MKILYIEDHPAQSDIMKQILEFSGCEVLLAPPTPSRSTATPGAPRATGYNFDGFTYARDWGH